MTSWGDNKAGIYGIYCRANGKWYVGQAQNIDRRNRDERRELNAGGGHNKHLQNAWDKYGEQAFSWVVLMHCPVGRLDDFERRWIVALDAFNKGFNMTTGGGGTRGYTLTEEHKAILREFNSNGKSPRKGRPLSAESKARMRAKALGGNSPKAKAVQQMTPADEVLATFDSIGDAARATGVNAAHISEVCRNVPKRKTAGGYVWRWAGGNA